MQPLSRPRGNRIALPSAGVFVRSLFTAGLILTASSAAGQDATTRNAVTALWQKAMMEQRVMLTCAATFDAVEDRRTNYMMVIEWDRRRANALDTMAKSGWPADELKELNRASAPAALRMPDETPFGEVLEFCHSHLDWSMTVARAKFMRLDEDVEKLLAP